MRIREKWDPDGLFVGYKAFDPALKMKTSL